MEGGERGKGRGGGGRGRNQFIKTRCNYNSSMYYVMQLHVHAVYK